MIHKPIKIRAYKIKLLSIERLIQELGYTLYNKVVCDTLY